MVRAAALATRAITPAMPNAIRYPCSVGSGSPPTRLVWCTSTAATTALETAWPMVRIRTLTPFADAVWPAGTARRMSVGSAE